MMIRQRLLQMKAAAAVKVVLLLLFLIALWWKLQPSAGNTIVLSLAIVILLPFVVSYCSRRTATMNYLRRLFSCNTIRAWLILSSKTIVTAMDLTEEERDVCRRRQFRIRAFEYMKYSPEQNSDERNAMAALMEFEFGAETRLWFCDDDGVFEVDVLEQVMGRVKRHCPRLVDTTANNHFQQLLLYASSDVIGSVVKSFPDTIEWTHDLACQAIHRCSSTYQQLPEHLQNNDDILFKALACGVNPSEIKHSYLLSKNKEFIVKALQVNPWVYARCQTQFISDKAVLLQVIGSGDSKFLSELAYTLNVHHGREIHDVLVPFIMWVEKRLKAHESFHALLACITVTAVRSQQAGDTTTSLQLFHCGEETSIALKRSIGELLDAPIHGEDEVTKLKRCWTNIEIHFPRLMQAKGKIML